MATVEKQPQYDAPYFILDNERIVGGAHIVTLPGFEGRRTYFGNYTFWKLVKVVCL